MRSLSDIEKDEAEVVDAISKTSSARKFDLFQLRKRRDELAAEKSKYLAAHPTVLRKASEEEKMSNIFAGVEQRWPGFGEAFGALAATLGADAAVRTLLKAGEVNWGGFMEAFRARKLLNPSSGGDTGADNPPPVPRDTVSPGGSAGSGSESPSFGEPHRIYHSDDHCNVTLYTAWGSLKTDAEGECRFNAAHSAMHAELEGRGFHRCKAEGCVRDNVGKSAVVEAAIALILKHGGQTVTTPTALRAAVLRPAEDKDPQLDEIQLDEIKRVLQDGEETRALVRKARILDRDGRLGLVNAVSSTDA